MVNKLIEIIKEFEEVWQEVDTVSTALNDVEFSLRELLEKLKKEVDNE